MNRPIILDPTAWFGPTFPDPECCPLCHSREFVPILYGLPTEETAARAAAGEFVLGGCVLRGPTWCCKRCGHGWPPEKLWPTDEEFLAYRLRCRSYYNRPDRYLRSKAAKLRSWCVETIERRVRVPLLARRGTIHRKTRLKDGGYQFIIRFAGAMVRVRPDRIHPSRLEASCLRNTLAGTRENRRYEAAALHIVMKQQRS